MQVKTPRHPTPGKPSLTLVLGGARSGKSRHAEALVMAHPPPWIYVATAAAHDDEMADRIAAHRARRHEGWRTLEAPLDLAGALDRAAAAPVLVDCLTLWLSNLLLGEHDIEAAIRGLDMALERRGGPRVLVSNEVGLGIVPENTLARRFRDAAGSLHQRLAARADHVVLVTAGLPLVLKSAGADV
ncbi:bifunctional adenosylcobinamide kinase/adenosylcobinamide-phosphate guanylyltransferase [Lichenicoccus sp.]|uniref:bifunctional adenosylcobinamide kinase/adenosylcobinamide-phosphate guanylyltransferase n=1 Tax=Lichenicoccus sp. TaxID=2781899 RepID=UPI003D0A4E91